MSSLITNPAGSAPMTGAAIKAAYESQSDTNAFTDAEKTKLAGLSTELPNVAVPFESLALMTASTEIAVGSRAFVEVGYNGEPEFFDIVASATHTANAQEVINLTGISGQAVSLRKWFKTYAHIAADTRTFADGVDLAVSSIGAYRAVSSGAHIANAGGQGLEVQPASDGSMSILAFGAVGDGVTNNATAIQAALNAGSVVTIPETGDFVCNSIVDLTSDLKLIGFGGWITQTDGTYTEVFRGQNISNLVLDGVNIKGASAGSGANSVAFAVFLNKNVHNIVVENCHIKDIGLEALSGEVGMGVYVGETALAADHSSNIRIANNTIENIKGWGANAGDAIYVRNASEVKIVGNTIRQTRRMGIAVTEEVDGVKIIGNDISDGYLAGIDIEPNPGGTFARNIVISNNTIHNFAIKTVSTGSQFYGIDIHGQSFLADVVVTGNAVRAENAQSLSCIHAQNMSAGRLIINDNLCQGGANANYGISLTAGSGVNNCTVSNNVIDGVNIAGIRSAGASNEIVISGNVIKLEDVVSAEYGIILAGATSAVISENKISADQLTGACIYFNAAGFVVANGNYMESSSAINGAIWLRVSGSGQEITANVVGNMFKQKSGTAQGRCLFSQALSSATIDLVSGGNMSINGWGDEDVSGTVTRRAGMWS